MSPKRVQKTPPMFDNHPEVNKLVVRLVAQSRCGSSPCQPKSASFCVAQLCSSVSQCYTFEPSPPPAGPACQPRPAWPVPRFGRRTLGTQNGQQERLPVLRQLQAGLRPRLLEERLRAKPRDPQSMFKRSQGATPFLGHAGRKTTAFSSSS